MTCSVLIANIVPLKKGDRIRAGITWPEKTCDGCGETKLLTRFPKRGGMYRQYKEMDPRRYDNQCKRCRKPARPGQSRDEIKEPKNVARARGSKKTQAAIRKKKRTERAKLTAREYKQRVREETRIRSMVYLADKGCEECGERDPRKLEYDHKNPGNKKRVIADLITDGYSWGSPVLSGEVAKCRIVCANCHRVHTIKQQGYYAFESVQKTLGKLAARHKFRL